MEISSVENIFDVIHTEQLIGFWDWNIPTREKFMSPVFKKMLGYEDYEISNNADLWMQLIFKEDQHKVIKSYQKHIASSGAVAYENSVRYHHKNGSPVHILSKGKVMEWDFLGNPIRMIGYYANVSTLLRETSSLQRDNEQLRFVTEAVNPATWVWDIKTGDITWSDKFYKLLGYGKEEIKASYFTFFHVLISKGDSKEVIQAIDNHLKKNQPFNMQINIREKSGKLEQYEIGGKAKLDKNNEPEKLFGFIRQKNVPENTGAQKAFTFNNDNGRTANMGEWIYNMADENVTWSKELYSLFELEQDFKPGFETVIRLYSQESKTLLQKALNEVVYYQKEYDLDLLCITGKGQEKWVRETGKPILDKDGTLTGIFGVIEDIDKRKRKELSLAEANRQMTDKNKRLQNFAHIAAHNLQTHASNLKTTLEYIDAAENDAEKNFFMDAVKKVSHSFSQTLEHLNELVKVEDEMQEHKEPVYFQTILENVLSSLSTNISQTNTSVQTDFSKCTFVNYVPAYLESILFNLVSNAVKYRQPGRNPLVVIKSYIKNGYKMLAVKDNGQGIDLDKHGSKVFGLYKTFHSNPEAHGIGLFMTKNQVEAMGGFIQIESEPGLGTTFIIQFNEKEND